ncbi:hypothetical protein [Pseudobutyrivibrio sp.]|uniref:hypothetical protein n=1 Tax=Pseudobutyrivibrio sp. TaxID=2014367 RepID=UPI003863C03D
MKFKFNNIAASFILWGLVEFCSIIYCALRRRREQKKRAIKELYIKRVLRLLPKCADSIELLRELYYSFGNNRYLRSILIRAIRYQEKQADNRVYVSAGFSYIERKLGCEPINYMHRYLSENELEVGNYSLVDLHELEVLTQERFSLWKTENDRFLTYMKKQRTKLLFEKSVLLFCNLLIYLKYSNDITLLIFAVVNTIGLVSFIILDYDCCVVDEKKHEGNLARKNKGKKRALAKDKRLREIFQIAGGMGLIVNITLFAIHLLEQEALF